jgi:RHS repeat-associated protein
LTATGTATFPVSQTLSGLSISPDNRTINVNTTLPFSANPSDQFGTVMGTPPALTCSYDAYGALHSDLDSSGGGAETYKDPYGFGGQYGYYTDQETGLLLLTHRYYDPTTGRFLNRDPISYNGGINLYGFAGNNPVNDADPSGFQSTGSAPAPVPEPAPEPEKDPKEPAKEPGGMLGYGADFFDPAVIDEIGEAYRARQAATRAKIDAALNQGTAEDILLKNNGLWQDVKKSSREKYLGRTPGKASATGRQVIARMESEGKIVKSNSGTWVEHNASKTYTLLPYTDMGHQQDAVQWWNTEGYLYGPKAAEVRNWMLDPLNYELEPRAINRSRGASLKDRYRKP